MKTAGLGHIELLSGPVLGSAWGIFLPGESFQAIHAWGMPSRIFDVRPAQRRQIFSMASPEHGWLRKTLPEGIFPTLTLVPDPKSTLYVPIRPISQISENDPNPNSA